MANATVAQTTTPINFTRQDLNVAANRALAIVGSDASWCRAIERAVLHLGTGRFVYDGHQVTLHSASTDDLYRIDTTEPMKCSCKGRARGYRCWHVVAARLIVRAAEHHAEQQTVGVTYKGVYYTPAQLEASRQQRETRARAAQAAADALFS